MTYKMPGVLNGQYHLAYMWERRLEKCCQSNQSTWSVRNMDAEVKTLSSQEGWSVSFPASPQTGATWMPVSISYTFLVVPKLLIWWCWALSPSVRRNHLGLDHCSPFAQLPPGKVRALEARKEFWEQCGQGTKYWAVSSMEYTHPQVG